MSPAEDGLDVPDVAPELVAVPEPEREDEDEVDELLDERELAEVVWVDLRVPVPTTVPLPLERPVLAEPVGFRTGVTKVEFWPAGTLAAADWAVATAG